QNLFIIPGRCSIRVIAFFSDGIFLCGILRSMRLGPSHPNFCAITPCIKKPVFNQITGKKPDI
ncbi:MAG: hypothetical protein ACYTFX_05620, partial [Planctomycetota bacterium]